MFVKILAIAGMLTVVAVPAARGDDGNAKSGYGMWLTDSPRQQLYMEGLDDQKGMGRVFIPAMTSPASEPKYAVFDGDELVGEQAMGSSFFLMPGDYKILLGTGTLEQRIARDVAVHRGETLIIEPDWCALTIEVIDESRNYVKQDLQIYKIETLENYGVIPAINPELGEQLQTLILAPGLYKIVERGGDINTFRNFTTVLLEPGSYTPYTIVVNTETRDFIGSGILTSATQLRQLRYLKLFGAAHGSVILNAANDASSRKMKTNLNIITQLENRIQYDPLPHFYLANNLIEIGAIRQQGEAFLISQDRVQLKNTYVYYLLKWIGSYARLELTTHIFPTVNRFDAPRNIVLRGKFGQDDYKTGVEEIELARSFFPLGLKEGFGVNVTPFRTFIARVNLRSGFGFRQTYNRDVYQLSTEADTIYTIVPDSYLRGIETSLISHLSLLRNIAITTELDVLFPLGQKSEPVLDLENIISLGVTRNVSIEHIFRLSSDPAYNWTIYEQFVQVRLSYFIF